jgi:type I restriction enzyme M protein
MAAIKTTIYEHPEFATFVAGMNDHFAAWRQKTTASLKGLQPGFQPKELIKALAEGLLAHYEGLPLIDAYDVYQHLMDYWAETMQDDAYFIAAEGWKAETHRVIEKAKTGKKKGQDVDKGWACDLIPKEFIVHRYFADEQVAIDRLSVELESVTAKLTELEAEHGGEDAAFSEFDKIDKDEVSAKLKEIRGDPESADEVAVLTDWLKLKDDEADLKKRLKQAEAELDAKAETQYPRLSEAEIKTLVVDDKWMAALETALRSELDRVSQRLTGRVKELAERYEMPLPQIERRVTELEARVNNQLRKMGFSWQ